MEGKKRIGMLTSLERERLSNYESLNATDKKNLNFRLKKKQNEIIYTISDINMLLKNLRNSPIEIFISHEHLYETKILIENILKMLGAAPIIDSRNADGSYMKVKKFKIEDPVNPGEAFAVTVSRVATEEEISIYKSLLDMSKTIKMYIDPDFAVSTLSSIEEFNRILSPLQAEAANKGKILEVLADSVLPQSNVLPSPQEDEMRAKEN
jgi:hypothetical protein